MTAIEKWHADIPITKEIVKKCIQQQFPSLLPIKELQQIGEGWDNKVFLLNEKIIFRFPRRKVAVELLERENKVLLHLPKFSNIVFPIPKYLGHPTTDYPYPFHGYEMLPGVAGHQAQLSDQDRAASISTLANFLKQLHSIDEKKALTIGAEQQIFDRTIVEKSINTLNERVDKIIARKICGINKTIFQQELASIEKLKLPKERCLVHGDLDSRHLLFNEKQLIGIIDWGDVGINNRSADLDIVWSFYPKSCHQHFFEIYGEVDAATWQYARFLGLYTAFTLLLYGKDINDNLLVIEAKSAIRRINADLLIEPK